MLIKLVKSKIFEVIEIFFKIMISFISDYIFEYNNKMIIIKINKTCFIRERGLQVSGERVFNKF